MIHTTNVYYNNVILKVTLITVDLKRKIGYFSLRYKYFIILKIATSDVKQRAVPDCFTTECPLW